MKTKDKLEKGGLPYGTSKDRQLPPIEFSLHQPGSAALGGCTSTFTESYHFRAIYHALILRLSPPYGRPDTAILSVESLRILHEYISPSIIIVVSLPMQSSVTPIRDMA